MGAIRFLFLLLVCSTAFAAGKYQYVRIPAAKLDKALFDKAGFIRDHKTHPDFIFGYLPKTQLNRSFTSRYGVKNLNEAFLRTIAFDGATLLPQEIASNLADDEAAEPYHTYETLTQELQTLVATYPSLASLESIGKSVQGREIWMVRLKNLKPVRESRPKLLYVSSMHGDEVTGKEMMVYLLRQLLQTHGRDPRVTALLDNAEIYIIPSMNPDGTALQQRWNANDVDLNRNFPRLDEDAASTKDREPETLALMALHQKHHFVTGMNFHGGEICVNLPWDSHANQKMEELFGDNDLMWELGNNYASTNKPLFDNHIDNFIHGVTFGFEWFQIIGGMQDWASHNHQTSHATLEISVPKWPGASQLPQYWKDNQASLLSWLEGSMQGFHLKVVDEAGNLLPTTVTIDTATRPITYATGYVHRPAIAKSRKVEISSAGFQTVSLDQAARPFDGVMETVVLKKR